MKFASIPLSWVDFLTVAVLLVGFVRGRKRGLSEELLDTTQWLTILIAGILLYRPLGDFMAQQPWLSHLTYYVLSYLLIALVIKIVFVMMKRQFGEKLVESDLFGRGEFYLGMGAGMLRWTCMYVFALSLLHAPHYTQADIEARRKEVEYNYGSDFFPGPQQVQAEVFKTSITGKNIEKYLPFVLLSPTSGEATPLRHENSMGRRRERELDNISRR